MRAGLVTNQSKYGIQLDNDTKPDGEIAWFNWTKPDYREEPWEADEVQKGDTVEVSIVDDKFIQTVRVVGGKDSTQEPTSAPSGPSPDGDDQWVLKDKRLGRQTAVKAAAVVLAAYIGNHAGIERDDILQFYDDLLAKAGVFID